LFTVDVVVIADDLYRARAVEPVRRLILCRVLVDVPVVRYVSKWSELTDDVYPRYCSSLAYVMSTDVVLAFARVASRVVFFKVDHIYLTGLLTDRYVNNVINVTNSSCICGAQTYFINKQNIIIIIVII